MSKKVVSMDVNSNALGAAQLMVKNKVGSLILTKEGKPIGVVTERDFLKWICARDSRSSEVTLESIMSSPLVTIEPAAPIEVAANIMAINNVRRLLVLDDNEQVVGVITSKDLARYLEGKISIDEVMGDILKAIRQEEEAES
jgi:CBS domain-containing protein